MTGIDEPATSPVLDLTFLLLCQAGRSFSEDPVGLLRESFRECDRIVEAEVVQVIRAPGYSAGHAQRTETTIAELRVLRTVFGDGDSSTLYAVLPGSSARSPDVLAPGDLAIWFLARERNSSAIDLDIRRLLRRAARPAGLQEVVSDGVGRFSFHGSQGELVLFPSRTLAPDGTDIQAVSRETFDSLLCSAIEIETPRITLTVGLTELVIDSSGSCTYRMRRSHTSIPFGPGGLWCLLDTLERESFETLPRTVGYACCPDTGSRDLEVRSDSGIRRVAILGSFDRTISTAEARRAYARALRILDALPRPDCFGLGRR